MTAKIIPGEADKFQGNYRMFQIEGRFGPYRRICRRHKVAIAKLTSIAMPGGNDEIRTLNAVKSQLAHVAPDSRFAPYRKRYAMRTPSLGKCSRKMASSSGVQRPWGRATTVALTPRAYARVSQAATVLPSNRRVTCPRSVGKYSRRTSSSSLIQRRQIA